MPHNRSVRKVIAHGIKGTVAMWIHNWLNNRKQRVMVNGYILGWRKVCSGVSQG